MLNLFSQKSEVSFSKKQAFGLDFNNSSLRILQFDGKDDNLQVSGWSERKLSKEIINDFEITQPDKFKESFEIAIESAKGKISGKKAVISIPENKVFTRVVSMPLIDPSQAGEAVKWEAESNIPISIDEVYFDWQLLRTIGKKMDVLVVATPKKIIDNYLSIMDKIGIELVACEAESVATGRSVIEKDGSDFVLVVDIGFNSASFGVYWGAMPIFTSSSSVSGRMFTDAVEKYLGLTFEKAESYKIKNGISGKNKKEETENLKIFGPVISLLTQEIEKTINFFNTSLEIGQKAQIKKIIMTGGGSNLKGLDALLSTKLGKIIACSDPWINLKITKKDQIMGKEKSQSFSTVIGLALRAQNYESYN